MRDPSTLGYGGGSAIACALAVGCAGPSSALDPAGRGAESIASLFWWMTAGALGVWLVVVGITLYATFFSRGGGSMRAARRLVIGGGVVLPILLLTVLLVYGLKLIPPVLAACMIGSGALEI